MAGECGDKKNGFKCNEGSPGKNQGKNSENQEDMGICENDEGRWGTYHGAGCVDTYAGDNHSPAMTGRVTPQARPRAALDSMNIYDTFCHSARNPSVIRADQRGEVDTPSPYKVAEGGGELTPCQPSK